MDCRKYSNTLIYKSSSSEEIVKTSRFIIFKTRLVKANGNNKVGNSAPFIENKNKSLLCFQSNVNVIKAMSDTFQQRTSSFVFPSLSWKAKVLCDILWFIYDYLMSGSFQTSMNTQIKPKYTLGWDYSVQINGLWGTLFCKT